MADIPVRFLRPRDGDAAAVAGERVAVIGYGNLGSAMANNLRDAGLHVTIGNLPDRYAEQAGADGFSVRGIAEAAASSDIAFVLLADEVIPDAFARDIAPALSAGAAVVFASGYCLAAGLVEPADTLDVLLLAPRMLGAEVRATVLAGTGYFSYVSVEQDATGRAWTRLGGLAHAAGTLQRGAMVLPAAQEAVLDLFVEQTVGAYVGTALQVAFAVGTDAGLPAEALVMELYRSGEMGRTFDTFARNGFYRSVTAHGLTAEFGGYLRTLEIDQAAMRAHFVSVLEDVRDGGFAAKFQHEQALGYPTLAAIEAITAGDDEMTRAEERIRGALES